MNNLIEHLEFTVFDFETTGFKPRGGAEIIEVGAVRIEQGEITESFQEFVSPNDEIPDEVQELTGIGPGDVEGARPVEEVLPDFLDFSGDSVLVAHNTNFDMKFLRYYSDESLDPLVVDTLTICRQVGWFSSNKLDDLVVELGIEREDAHRAHEDARATGRLLIRMAEEITSFDDYDRCDIPVELVERDIDLILQAVPGLSSDGREYLSSEFETVDKVRRAIDRDNELDDELTDTEVNFLEEFFNGWDEKDDLYEYLTEHGKMTLTQTINSRFWSPVNWLLNGLGLALIVTAVVGTRDAQTFSWLAVMSIPCFLSSMGVAYFRSRPHARIKQMSVVVITFGSALLYLIT